MNGLDKLGEVAFGWFNGREQVLNLVNSAEERE